MIYDILIIFCYLLINVILPIGSYWVFSEFFDFKVKKADIFFGNFLLFNKEKMLLFKGEKLMFFISYFINFLLLITAYIIYVMLIALPSTNFVLYISLVSLIFLLGILLFCLYIYLTFKKINKFKFYSRTEVELNYSIPKSNEQYKTILLLEGNNKSPYNNVFKFHQNRLKKKLNKDINNKKDNYKNYIIFLRYIRNYSTFIDRIIRSNRNITVISNDLTINIEELEKVLVENFYSLSRV
ncbi:hypothetical protein [Spiroplasma floricola]|uniref:Uncharacterized protein n=1 Tax=Spiroplasma floricola 23-6 TaxID=1336749 RepID=A0A2K8SCQ6_9MOLU|nr:hypothetical protein [Spiroplasma floricola]AUB31257.1 hypothetical protein SFLOR_v1c01960 [Spiroplasma floricola 23-6]